MSTFKSPEDAPTELGRVLLRAVPENERGNKTITHFAKLAGLSTWAVNKWIKAQKVSPERAMQIVEISKITGFDDAGKPVKGSTPRVRREELDKFVYTS